MDEIGDLPLHLQMKLLRVLQNKEFERVGGTKTIHVDVRFIAATNRDLTTMIREGTFREDLYYRLSVIPLHIPALREHPEDIPALIHHFVSRCAAKLRRDVTAVSEDAMSFLTQNDWPGNVRELENVIEYSVNMAQGNMIRISDLPPYLKKDRPDLSLGSDSGLKQNIENYENYVLIQQLKDVEEGRLTKEELARKLGISRSSLYRRINRLTKSKQ